MRTLEIVWKFYDGSIGWFGIFFFFRCHRRYLPQPATRRRSITAHSNSIYPFFRTIMPRRTRKTHWNQRKSSRKRNRRVPAHRPRTRARLTPAPAVNCPLITRTRVHQDTRPVPTTCPEVLKVLNSTRQAQNPPRNSRSKERRASIFWPSCKSPGKTFLSRKFINLFNCYFTINRCLLVQFYREDRIVLR